MDVNRINSQSHSYFKYVVAFSVVTTVALSIFRYTKPHALSWKWSPGCVAITVILGLTHLKLVKIREQHLQAFRKQLTTCNQQFAKTNDLQEFSSVEYDKDFHDICQSLDADLLTDADNGHLQEFNAHIKHQNTLNSLSEQLEKHELDLKQFQNRLTCANEPFRSANSFEETLNVKYDNNLHDICQSLDADLLPAVDNDLFRIYQDFTSHIERYKKVSSMSILLEKNSLVFTQFRELLTKDNKLFKKAALFEEFISVNYNLNLYKICQNLEKAQTTHPKIFLEAHKEFAKHMKLRLVFDHSLNHINEAGFLKLLQRAFTFDLSGFLKKLINLDETDKIKKPILKQLLEWIALSDDRVTLVKKSVHWNALSECAKLLDLKVNEGKFDKQEN